MKTLVLFFFLFASVIHSREIGQTEITTEEGIEVYQKEKYYLLKKNVQIESDNFILKAFNVKAHFDNDLYDITDIYAQGDVHLNSTQGIRAIGNKVDYNIKRQHILIEGKSSYLETNQFKMKSNGLIELDNSTGRFKLVGLNSQMISNEINITGENIKGTFINVNDENIVEKLIVEDKTQVNIKTETLNMFALKAEFDKKNNMIKLYDNVKIFRGDELITGDQAEINTFTESYKIKSKNSNKVKVLLKRTDE